MKKTLILSLLFIGSLGLKAQTTDMTNKIDSIIKINLSNNTPGCVIGVIKDGSLGLIEFKRNKEGKVTGFVIADVGRLRNIEFTKKD